MSLAWLPTPALRRMLEFVLLDEPSQTMTLLTQYGKHISDVTLSVLHHKLVVVDDDAVLLAAATSPDCARIDLPRAHHEHFQASSDSQLSTVWHRESAAGLVQRLKVVPISPATSLDDSIPCQETSRASTSSSDADDDNGSRRSTHPLDTKAFLCLLSKLTNLSTFEWTTTRAPTFPLCEAITLASPHLTVFRFDPSNFQRHGSSSTCITVPSTVRWDAQDIDSLPKTIVHLELSNLSQAGVKALGLALSSLQQIETLNIHHTPFFDDALAEEIASNEKRLKRLRIGDMSGTKFTDAGIVRLLEDCWSLEELELDCVEGRLSKTCWSKVSDLPDKLQSLVLRYSETGPHKSWTLDHLTSLKALLASPNLVHVSIARRLDPACLVFGSHESVICSIDPLMTPSPCPEGLYEALMKRAGSLQTLDLTLFALDGSKLKYLMDQLTNVVRIDVLLDGEFKMLTNLATSFAACTDLRHFEVYITPSRMPRLTPLKEIGRSSQLPISPTASPDHTRAMLASPPTTVTEVPESPPHSRRASACGPLILHPALEHAIPATKDWRKLLRKTHNLESVAWAGRGGVGTWYFHRRVGTLGVQIDFEPIKGTLSEFEPFASSDPVRSPELGPASDLFDVDFSLVGTCLQDLDLSPQASRTSPSSASSPSSPARMLSSPVASTSPKRAMLSPVTHFGGMGLGITGVAGPTPFNSPSSGPAPVVYPGGWHTPKKSNTGGKKGKSSPSTYKMPQQQSPPRPPPQQQSRSRRTTEDFATREAERDQLWEAEKLSNVAAVSNALSALGSGHMATTTTTRTMANVAAGKQPTAVEGQLPSHARVASSEGKTGTDLGNLNLRDVNVSKQASEQQAIAAANAVKQASRIDANFKISSSKSDESTSAWQTIKSGSKMYVPPQAPQQQPQTSNKSSNERPVVGAAKPTKASRKGHK
ncbi:hypothetical protein OIO90_006044 [Microbotryomycetes sp. JL221]|nr:hypothetical protein OIO90_006044 [Microbotryomycetes sp. JL221]